MDDTEGLLPQTSRLWIVCCRCNQVQDELGRWQASRPDDWDATRMRVSHGLCPDCGTLERMRIEVHHAKRDLDKLRRMVPGLIL